MSRQMWYLFISNLSILCVGFGLFPLLPVYAGRLGATPSLIGIYLALTYISITLGTMLTGWLSGKVAHKRMLVSAGVVGASALALLSLASNLWQLIVLTGVVWFTGGIGLSVLSVLTGLYAEEKNRGKWFGMMSLANPMGAIIGSLLVGQIVEWQGYSLMFTLMAVEYAIWPLIGLFLLQNKPVGVRETTVTTTVNPANPGRTFHLLLLAILLSAMTVSVNRLGLSHMMKAQNFNDSAISLANLIGGLVTIPVVLCFGKLSDRLGRRLFLEMSYLFAALGGLTLILAGQAWQFWLVSATTLVARSISVSIAPAMAADMLKPEALSRNLPWVGAATWMAGVVGFAGSGIVIDLLGENSLFLVAAIFALISVVLVSQLPGSGLKLNKAPIFRRLNTENCEENRA